MSTTTLAIPAQPEVVSTARLVYVVWTASTSPAEIPARERWVWNRPNVLASLRRGIDDLAKGWVYDLGSFEQYADLDVDK